MKFNKEVYTKYDAFSDSDRDFEIKNRSVKLVKIRKEQVCMLGDLVGLGTHDIKVGELVRVDKGIVEDMGWQSYYTCLNCMDKWLIDEHILDENGNIDIQNWH